MQAIGSRAGGSRAPASACPPRGALGASSPAESSGRTSSRTTQQQAPGRQQRRRPLAAAAAPKAGGEQQVDYWGRPLAEGQLGFADDPANYDWVDVPDGIEGHGGYTPFELIDWTDCALKHEVVTRVAKPVSEVYALWEDRLNWPKWFGMIEEVGFTEGDDQLCALNMWYRWANTPWLQLYVALRRTEAQRDKFIVEQPEDGAPLVAAALFQEDGPGATLVTLRISYLLPSVLHDFAGRVAVYGDVDRKLAASMDKMRQWVEAADCGRAAQEGAARMQALRQELPADMQRQQEHNAVWEAEKQRQLAAEQYAEQRQEEAEAAAEAVAREDARATAAAAEKAQLVADEAAAAAAAGPKRRGPKTKAERRAALDANGAPKKSAGKSRASKAP